MRKVVKCDYLDLMRTHDRLKPSRSLELRHITFQYLSAFRELHRFYTNIFASACSASFVHVGRPLRDYNRIQLRSDVKKCFLPF